jgi:glutathione S-transferase
MKIMPIRFYDLAGADENLRFSPFCWRTRMSLAHKALPYETIPWRFGDKAKIAASGQGAVPVIVDGGKMIHDSWVIANYLDDNYPGRPLFGNAAARGAAMMIKFWAERTLHPLLSRILILDIFAAIDEKDRDYFRESREKRFGTTLEQWCSEPEKYREQFRLALEPVRLTVGEQAFIAGAAPAFVDYIVFGALQWARCVSPAALLEKSDPVYAWRERLLDAFDGLGRKALPREQ